MTTIKGNLIMKEDMTFKEDLRVEGNILGKDGDIYSLIVKGNLDCWNLNCWNLNCWNLDCWNLNCCDLDCRDLNCWNLDCWNLNCKEDVSYYAVAFAYNNIKCKSIKGRRKNARHFVLDGEIEISGEKLT